jgi:pimeloyl-ACP methyl ester carboxylesterase
VPRIEIDTGLHLYYETEGRGDAVLLVQGLDRDHRGMALQTKVLAEHYQVISYDARGIGQSDTPPGPYTCAQLADDIRGLLKALGIGKSHLIGASLGGHVVQEFAINYPEMTGSIILMCTFARASGEMLSTGRLFIDSIESRGHAYICEEMMRQAYSSTYLENEKGRFDAAWEKLREMDATYNIRGFQWTAEAGLSADTRDRVSSIKTPALVMAGELDYLVPPSLCEEQLVRPIRGSRLVVIKDAGHLFFDEKPEAVNREILAFLASLPKNTRDYYGHTIRLGREHTEG